MLIDTHAHLYLDAFDDDIDEIIQRSKDNNVKMIFLPNIDSGTTEAMNILADRFPGFCLPMIGLHPCSVKEDFKAELDHLVDELKQGKYYGVGETGIDLYWDVSFKEQQIEAFEFQIALAKEHGLPVIIHSRDSLDLTIEIIEKHHSPELKGIFHCFNGSVDQARRIQNINFMMGLGGVITFKNAKMDDVLSFMDSNNIVLETDAPYLSPVPYRGKRNESSYIPYVAEKLAEVKSISIQEVETFTTQNAKSLFGVS
ncbi:MAG: TatD family hydrolase [Saprospiraceae bacterium]|nr:TatD family hydrolase [Saprospiraceae bacterium]